MNNKYKKVYVVTAKRWGNLDTHNYLVGCFSNLEKALEEAEIEENYRGGKYSCFVCEVDIDSFSKKRNNNLSNVREITIDTKATHINNNERNIVFDNSIERLMSDKKMNLGPQDKLSDKEHLIDKLSTNGLITGKINEKTFKVDFLLTQKGKDLLKILSIINEKNKLKEE